jgi:hypothetical protein
MAAGHLINARPSEQFLKKRLILNFAADADFTSGATVKVHLRNNTWIHCPKAKQHLERIKRRRVGSVQTGYVGKGQEDFEPLKNSRGMRE